MSQGGEATEVEGDGGDKDSDSGSCVSGGGSELVVMGILAASTNASESGSSQSSIPDLESMSVSSESDVGASDSEATVDEGWEDYWLTPGKVTLKRKRKINVNGWNSDAESAAKRQRILVWVNDLNEDEDEQEDGGEPEEDETL